METVKETAKKTRKAGPGRPKGVPNKQTKELKNMILEALNKAGGGGTAGGIKYLTAQATANPKAFLALVGRVLPLQVTGENGGPVQVHFSGLDAEL